MSQDALDSELLSLLNDVSEEELEKVVQDLPDGMAPVLLDLIQQNSSAEELPPTPADMAALLVDGFRERPHIDLISEKLRQAVEDVEAGKNRRIVLSMPPRTAKTTTVSQVFPAWALSRNPNWKVALTSYDGALATSWARQIRRWIDEGKLSNLQLQKDSRAAGSWETIEGGGVVSRSIRQPFTGRGANILIIDDPHKDFVDAHSVVMRNQVWNWWLSVAQLRLEPPSLVVVVQTRWHEDDLVGRLLSDETEGDPADWEVISIPALALGGGVDALGREAGQPVISPLIDETEEEAIERWEKTRRDVGTYVFEAMYQQEPSDPQGTIFNVSWWRFWTTDPDLVDEENDQTVLVDWDDLAQGLVIDSWDMTFKGDTGNDYTVGQRWVKRGERRYLIAQQRKHASFTETVKMMKAWANTDDERLSPLGRMVSTRLIENSANGPAIIDTLKDEISGLKPVKVRNSKEARARAVSPEVEARKVFLPHPQQPGYSWVTNLLTELREFPTGTHDDQVDAMTQALMRLRLDAQGSGGISLPSGRVKSSLAAKAAPRGGIGSLGGTRLPNRRWG